MTSPGHPVFLNVAGQPVVVVGAGPVAERKVEALLEGGARVTAVAPTATPDLRARAARDELRHLARDYALSASLASGRANGRGRIIRTLREVSRSR